MYTEGVRLDRTPRVGSTIYLRGWGWRGGGEQVTRTLQRWKLRHGESPPEEKRTATRSRSLIALVSGESDATR